jgi:GH35 family endo-1,4-beta-xylanase
MTTRQTGNHDTRQTAIKQTIKQTKKQSVLVFDSDPDSVFGKYVWGLRPKLSKSYLWESLKNFERDKSFVIEHAHTEKLIEHVLAYIPSTEGD